MLFDSMKACNVCGTPKALSEFHRNAASKDGRGGSCKECAKARAAEWYKKNPERAKEVRKRYQQDNKEKCIAASRDWAAKNRERSREIKADWKRRNPELVRKHAREAARKDPEKQRMRKKQYRALNPDAEILSAKAWREKNTHRLLANNAARRAKRIQATPPWLTDEHKRRIQLTYLLAKTLSTATREPHHVDHIIPLRGESVCGLHVPWNLKAMPGADNMSKGNRLEGA